MSEDRGLYADIIANDIGGILASIEGEIYGPGVPSLDPGLSAGDSVPVAFILPNSSRQPLLLARRPVLKEIAQGVWDHFMSSPFIYGLWTQYEGNPQRNNYSYFATTPRQFSGTPFVNLPTGIKFPNGLVAFSTLDKQNTYLGVSYYVKDLTDGGKSSKICYDWYSALSGTLYTHFEFPSTITFSAHLVSAVAVNPANLHAILSPQEQDVYFSAFLDAGGIQQQRVTPYADDLRMTNYAGQNIFMAGNNHTVTPMVVSSYNWPYTLITPYSQNLNKGFIGLKRSTAMDSTAETITSNWTIDPKDLFTNYTDPLRRVVADCSGDLNRGFPATLDNQNWIVGATCKQFWDITDPSLLGQTAGIGYYHLHSAGLGNPYGGDPAVPFSIDPTKYCDKAEAVVASIAADTGNVNWAWSYQSQPSLAVTDLSVTVNAAAIFRDQQAAASGHVLDSSGTTLGGNQFPTENQFLIQGNVTTGSQEYFTFTSTRWPAYPYGSLGPGDLTAQKYTFLRNASILFFPRAGQNDSFIGPPATPSAYCSSITPNIVAWTDYLKTANGANETNTPGIYVDSVDGSIYFSLADPAYQFLHFGAGEISGSASFQTVLPNTPNPPYNSQTFHVWLDPHVYNTWTSILVCLNADGTQRWAQEISQYLNNCGALTSVGQVGNEKLASGIYSSDLKLADNVWVQSPAAGKTLFILRDNHDLGPNNSPTTVLEIRRQSDGTLISTVSLRLDDRTFSGNYDSTVASDSTKNNFNWRILGSEAHITSGIDSLGLAWAYVYAVQTDHNNPIYLSGTTTVTGYARHDVMHLIRMTGELFYSKATVDATTTGQVIPSGSDEWATMCVVGDSLAWVKKTPVSGDFGNFTYQIMMA